MPVGKAPVVVNATAVSFAGAVATVTTAGDAIVIVAVCVANVSSTAQFVAVNGDACAETNAHVANAVVVVPTGAVIPKDTGVSVRFPVPTAVIFAAAPPTLVDSLIVCEPE